MLYLDFEADTEKEATQLALESLGLNLEDITIEPIHEGKKSFFGLGKKEKAKIRVYYKEKSEINDIIYTVKTLIHKIDKNSLVEIESDSSQRYVLKIETVEPGKLIGKNGRAIEAIQILINGILQRHGNKHKIVVDVENYNERQMNRILMQAKKKARQVQKTSRPITLETMNPFQRRLIHLELQKMRGITTKSNGEGKYKKITINYTGPSQARGNDSRRSGNFRHRNSSRPQRRPRRQYHGGNESLSQNKEQSESSKNTNQSSSVVSETPGNSNL